MKTKDDIISELFGIRKDAKDSTPMDKGECKLAMNVYLIEYRKEIEKILNTN